MQDGTVRHVFHEVDPIGVHMRSFKKPSSLELAHDCRIAQVLAALGLVRDVRRELNDLGPGALLWPRNLLSGYLGMMAISIGVGGTLILCWIAVLMTFIRLAAELG